MFPLLFSMVQRPGLKSVIKALGTFENKCARRFGHKSHGKFTRELPAQGNLEPSLEPTTQRRRTISSSYPWIRKRTNLGTSEKSNQTNWRKITREVQLYLKPPENPLTNGNASGRKWTEMLWTEFSGGRWWEIFRVLAMSSDASPIYDDDFQFNSEAKGQWRQPKITLE